MYTKQLPKSDSERIEALQAALTYSSCSTANQNSLPADVVKYIQPFLVKFQNSIYNNSSVNGTQSVNHNTLRELIDELLLDIWEETHSGLVDAATYSTAANAVDADLVCSFF